MTDLALALMQGSEWTLLQPSLKDLLVLEGETSSTLPLAPFDSAPKPLSSDPYPWGWRWLTCSKPLATFQGQRQTPWGSGGAQAGEGHA